MQCDLGLANTLIDADVPVVEKLVLIDLAVSGEACIECMTHRYGLSSAKLERMLASFCAKGWLSIYGNSCTIHLPRIPMHDLPKEGFYDER